jgi:undecaprenyl diphosphate synthase
MDGNGRWARKRFLPRFAGHKSGLNATRDVVQACSDLQIKALTLFAFSSENWKRPKLEVRSLMDLFASSLKKELSRLHENNVRIRFIGDLSAFSKKLRELIAESEQQTAENTGLELSIAVNYGGRWDIVNAVQEISTALLDGSITREQIDTDLVSSYMSLSDLPEPDLFIRTGGEQRISNFLLWQLAYTELYFTDTLWPDFDKTDLQHALEAFSQRQRRYGKTGEQVEGKELNA